MKEDIRKSLAWKVSSARSERLSKERDFRRRVRMVNALWFSLGAVCALAVGVVIKIVGVL